jgi:5-methylcytosine-specific restriction enzyme B
MIEMSIAEPLKQGYAQMREKERFPNREAIDRYLATFQRQFGPERLRELQGEELLNSLHAHGTKDSLVYWLEFKNDEEFPDYFGSIAGGSAEKFGIYRRRETGEWMVNRAGVQVAIDVPNAVEVATRHRDQLLAGCELLEKLTGDAPDKTYIKLQEQMNSVAPDVSDSAWAHKYFSLIFPTKIDDFHVENYQRFYIRKLLQLPPSEGGRYVSAGRYVSLATQLDITLPELAATLKAVWGSPYKVWRIGTRLGGTDSIWPMMRDSGCVAIGWSGVGDLSALTGEKNLRDLIRERLTKDGEAPINAGRNASQIANFIKQIAERDLVLAADGGAILGIGRVTGEYRYKSVPSEDAPHQRSVEWLDARQWQLPQSEGLRSTVREMKKHPENLVEIERRLLNAPEPHQSIPTASVPRLRVLEGLPGRIQAVLERKKQVILYGPPGTGKTYWALHTARQLAAQSAFGKSFDSLLDAERSAITGFGGKGFVRSCTFHPAYGYEDFIEGYRPKVGSDGQLHFELPSGTFKQLCRDAEHDSSKNFYLVIDEINRGDIPRIFGELITLLEVDKRGQQGTAALLPLSREPFSVPDNVFVIGTMNTADRSIALLDTALRRRFGFIELMPDPAALGDAVVADSIPLALWLSALNGRVRTHAGRDARNLQIGHAYFMEQRRPVTDLQRFARILSEDIVPLLEEYCYENFEALRNILGGELVDFENQRIRTELFAADQRDALIRAVLEPCPEIATSGAVVAQSGDEEPEADEPPDEVK